LNDTKSAFADSPATSRRVIPGTPHACRRTGRRLAIHRPTRRCRRRSPRRRTSCCC